MFPGLRFAFWRLFGAPLKNCETPHVGPRYRTGNSQLQNLRSWPVTGFEAIRIYYVPDDKMIRVIRILHGKRDVKRILGDGD